ncbi:MAG: hypothetical protein AAFW75_17935 [Cyanobacteria bacterium J06636_16]
MKRFVLSALTILLVATAIAPASAATAIAPASAADRRQTDFNDAKADLNGDGVVTLSELRRHNRDARRTN